VWKPGVPTEQESHTAVARAAAEAMGVLSVRELRACGLTDSVIRSWVRQGRLHRIHRGVYAVGHAGLTRHGRWLAAVKACGPHVLLSHWSAAMLYGFVDHEDRAPDVTIPASTKAAVDGVRVHRTRSVGPYDVRRHRGIPVTSPERTIFDLAERSTDRQVRRMMSRAQSMGLASLRTLARQLDGAAGRPSARYARVLAGTPPRTRSELEDRVHDLVLGAGFARPDANVALRLGGRRVVPDLRWPQARLCVEADSREWHDNPHARAEDAERQALLEASGERVVRITWGQATARVPQTVARLRAAGAPVERATAPAPAPARARPPAPRRSP
jgi:predicted transcriptional regulator of viral defense system